MDQLSRIARGAITRVRRALVAGKERPEPARENCKCYVCGSSIARFWPLFSDSVASDFYRLFEVVGSDVDNFYCRQCKSFDRERHLLMYFDKLDLWSVLRNNRVLHIAPEPHVRQRLTQLGLEEYVQGDLSPVKDGIVRIDVTAIPYPDDHFGFVICNHVLEHVPADSVALTEIRRVLRPGGLAILQTPYSTLLANTFQDPNIDTDERRKRLYGQEDHVRLFGLDLISKIQAHGLELDFKRHCDLLAEFDGATYGVNEREDLMLVRKPRAA